MARARNEGRLFSRIGWPRDPEIVSLLNFFIIKSPFNFTFTAYSKLNVLHQKEQVKRLNLLLKVKDSASNIPKNLEARRRLEFFTNSLFMHMPVAKPVSEMMPFWYASSHIEEAS